MKLLIVDDEELTRTGVISSINWEEIGITDILQADDGMNGLEMAQKYKPEIILCDVRMPRMDGITMLEHLESLLPDTVAIFMSGYSDKEYLKAAIKLKAVNYIEKPLQPAEIRQAVIEARELYLQKMRSHYGEVMQSVEVASRLALQLTAPYGNNKDTISHLIKELSLTITPETSFTSLIIKLDSFADFAAYDTSVYEDFQNFLKSQQMDCIFAEKRGHHLVYFIFCSTQPSKEVFSLIGNYLNFLCASYENYYIAMGETVKGIAHAYQSYESAVILLQSSFFFPNRTLLTPAVFQEEPRLEKALPDSFEKLFAESLSAKAPGHTDELLEKLYLFFEKNHTLFPNQAKDLYYKLFLLVENARTQQQLNTGLSEKEKNISDAMEHCFTFEQLHQTLFNRVHQFFEDVQNTVQENSTIFLIKEYISQNYMKESLSVKDISTHVFLSTSYVCTFFKNETGQTLNQYLTEFRMKKAKELLMDPRYKITEISSRVGYSDGNYFGKSFKKYSGYSPSEFREKLIK